MFDGAEVNEAEVLAWISKELSTNEVKPTLVRTTSLISIYMEDNFLVWSKLFSPNYLKKSIQMLFFQVKLVSRAVAEMLIAKREHVGLIFIDDEDADGKDIVDDLEKDMYAIEEEELTLVQIDDPEFAEELGLHLPSLVHFTNEIPNVYKGNMEDKDGVLKWLVDKKEESVIEVVTRQMLEEILEEEEYVAVLYTGSCEGQADLCEELLEHLEELDNEFDDKGIAFVQTTDEEYPLLKHSLTKLPALGIYRNKDHFLLYEGDLTEKVQSGFDSNINVTISGRCIQLVE